MDARKVVANTPEERAWAMASAVTGAPPLGAGAGVGAGVAAGVGAGAGATAALAVAAA